MATIPSEKVENEQLEKINDTGFCEFVKNLETLEDTIRLFERSGGDFYTLHGEDAFYAAEQIYKTKTVVKYLGGGINTGLPSLSLSKLACENFLKGQMNSKRIEIWSNNDGKKQNGWKIIKKATPGNLDALEDLLFDNFEPTTAPTVLAIKLGNTVKGGKVIGTCFIDNNEGIISISEFIDNEIFNNFESLLIQTGAMECIIPSEESYELEKIKTILNRCNIMITTAKKSEYSLKDIEENFKTLLIADSLPLNNLSEYDMKLGLASAACLISYLGLLQDSSNENRFLLKTHDLSQYMKLDGSALIALNLLPDKNSSRQKTMSLYGLLNQCYTAMGSRLLYQWLKQPLIKLEDINLRLDLVESFIDDHTTRDSICSNVLKVTPDLNGLAKKFRKNRATLQDVVRIYQFILKLPDMIEMLNNSQNIQLIRSVYSVKLEEYYEGLEKLKELVETTIDLERLDQHIYQIKSEFSEELEQISQQIKEIESNFQLEYEKVANKLGLEVDRKLKYENSSTYGHCFRLSRTDAVVLRSYQKDFIELAVQKAGTYFTTLKMKNLNEEYQDLNAMYNKIQSTLVKEVLEIVKSYTVTFELLNALVAHLDLIISFANVAINSNPAYVRPQFSTNDNQRELNLIGSRHPCLEVQPEVNFIPNDASMIQNQREFLIVTGPNMGGKSTYIRQIGMVSLMAQIGCYVPCDSANLPIFDCILARIGANDSQLKGMSTFMVEMLETSTILKSATENSLIIIDELGRGTSTHDGFGLAWSISDYICNQCKSMCLFATHFHELTKLKEEIPKVANLHVKVHLNQNSELDSNLTLLYKIEEGSCDQSLGIQVAKIAGFPKVVTDLATHKVNELENGNQRLITKEQKENIESIMREYILKYKANQLDSSIKSKLFDLKKEYPFLSQFNLNK
ncbi:DNA mismatch repair protein [Neoconidiobolus thromboides FSU 785]|nr:DNA mismatch repair protein [Neoconidiobolus thromboides FSU 785]